MFISEGFFEFSFGIKEIVVVAQIKELLVTSLQNMYLFLEWWWRKSLKASELFCRWKIHEACMLALGSVKSIITDSVKNGRIHFDMHGFLTNVVLADLNLSGMWDPASLGITAGCQALGVSDESVRLMCAWGIGKCTCAPYSCEKNLASSHVLPVLGSVLYMWDCAFSWISLFAGCMSL